MAKKASNIPEDLPRPKLIKPRDQAKKLLQEQVDKGRDLSKRNLENKDSLKQAEDDEKKWGDYNEQLLEMLFSNSKFSLEYRRSRYGSHVIFGDQSFWEDVADFQEDVGRQITSMESIAERINLIDEDETINAIPAQEIHDSSKKSLDNVVNSRKDAVFVVHGHDEELKNSVTTLLLKLNVRPIVLAEEVNAGRTLIEKFEHYADESNFAVVLLTPDDLGKVASEKSELEPRARQNVILELGYFMGKLGRENVCALIADKVSSPSDIAGVVYLPVDVANAWHYKLANELKEAGYNVDLNDI